MVYCLMRDFEVVLGISEKSLRPNFIEHSVSYFLITSQQTFSLCPYTKKTLPKQKRLIW